MAPASVFAFEIRAHTENPATERRQCLSAHCYFFKNFLIPVIVFLCDHLNHHCCIIFTYQHHHIRKGRRAVGIWCATTIKEAIILFPLDSTFLQLFSGVQNYPDTFFRSVSSQTGCPKFVNLLSKTVFPPPKLDHDQDHENHSPLTMRWATLPWIFMMAHEIQLEK